jgi:hypothetical protein
MDHFLIRHPSNGINNVSGYVDPRMHERMREIVSYGGPMHARKERSRGGREGAATCTHMAPTQLPHIAAALHVLKPLSSSSPSSSLLGAKLQTVVVSSKDS